MNSTFNIDDKNEQILELLAKGNGSKEISKIIFLSDRTIECRIAKLKEKLNAKNITHLVAIVQERKQRRMEVDDIPKGPEELKAIELRDAKGSDEARAYANFMIREMREQITFWNTVKVFIN